MQPTLVLVRELVLVPMPLLEWVTWKAMQWSPRKGHAHRTQHRMQHRVQHK